LKRVRKQTEIILQRMWGAIKLYYGEMRMDLGEVGWGDVDWIGLAKDRNRWRALMNSVLNLWVP
jgi:hypothetical protein